MTKTNISQLDQFAVCKTTARLMQTDFKTCNRLESSIQSTPSQSNLFEKNGAMVLTLLVLNGVSADMWNIGWDLGNVQATQPFQATKN